MNLLKRLFGSAPPVTAVPVADSIPWGQILAILQETSEPERVPLRLPDVLPGVRPARMPTKDTGLTLAMDGPYAEPLAMDGEPLAWAGGVGALGPGLAFLGFPYLAELVQISEYRIPSESLSTEMTRAWLHLKSKSNKKRSGDAENDPTAEKIKAIEARLEELHIRDLFREAALKTEQFGRAHLYVSVKGQDDDATRQLPLTTIGKGQLIGFRCIEPYWLTPYSWNATHPERPDFYRPQSWFVLGRKTHRTRLLTFIFREVPDLLKPAYDFAGISITQLLMPYVNRWLRTAKNVNDLINIFSIVTLSTDLQKLLQTPQEFNRRLKAFTQLRDNRGMLAVDKSTEELTTQNVPLGSLDKLQAQSQEHMATPARMPLIKFFGITPSGLNSSSEGEFQAWYDYVRGLQRLGFDAHVARVLELVQMDLFGEVDPEIVHEWLPLLEPTPSEESELRKADTERDAQLIQNNVIEPNDVRNKLKADPKSGYEGLEGDAPEPQLYAEQAEENAENEAKLRVGPTETGRELEGAGS